MPEIMGEESAKTVQETTKATGKAIDLLSKLGDSRAYNKLRMRVEDHGFEQTPSCEPPIQLSLAATHALP